MVACMHLGLLVHAAWTPERHILKLLNKSLNGPVLSFPGGEKDYHGDFAFVLEESDKKELKIIPTLGKAWNELHESFKGTSFMNHSKATPLRVPTNSYVKMQHST